MRLETVLRVRWLGRLPYAEAWDLQRGIWEGRAQGRTSDDYLLLLEHPPVYTLGRHADESNLLVSEEALIAAGAEVFRVDRGGDVTFHGPGQLVGYPIIGLRDPMQVVPYVRRLEQSLINALGTLWVEAWIEPGLTGVWTERGKVAAIGVRVARGVTMHGFALNVTTDLSYFAGIVPCGITDRGVTSVDQCISDPISVEKMAGVKPGEEAAEVPSDSTIVVRRDARTTALPGSPEVAPAKHKELSHA